MEAVVLYYFFKNLFESLISFIEKDTSFYYYIIIAFSLLLLL